MRGSCLKPSIFLVIHESSTQLRLKVGMGYEEKETQRSRE